VFDDKLGKGIGNRAFSKLRTIAENQNLPLWEVLKNANTFTDLKRWQSPFKRFVESTEKVIASAEDLSPAAAVEFVAKSLGTHSLAGARSLRPRRTDYPVSRSFRFRRRTSQES